MSDQGKLLPGQKLRAEREARGMSQEEAARRLNLTVTYLEALEADDYERLPEAAFVKGYIRNYARELDMPGDELADAFSATLAEQAEEEVPETVEVMPSPKRGRWTLVAIGVGLVIVIAAVVFWQQDDASTPSSAENGTEPGDGDSRIQQPASPETESVPGASAAAADAGSEGPSGPQPTSGEPEPRVEGPTDTAAAETRDDAEAASLDRLVMTFSAQCWLRVSDAREKLLFEGRRQAGVPLTLTGTAPFEIKVGDASAVSGVTVNEDDVSMPSSAPGQVVRMSAP